ncbi:MAG: hypothetical protein QOF10_6842 [Kribbellaceae bacterium]|nr:hypothetical protein [Kribbellaceae bacterium]
MAEQNETPVSKKRTDPTSQLARGELVHADVKPLDLSGIPTVIVGIVAWAVAFVVVLIFRNDLKKDGNEWWLWVTVAGFGLGWIGLAYCRRRWAAIQAGQRPETED